MRSSSFPVVALMTAATPAIAQEDVSISVHAVDETTRAAISSAALLLERPGEEKPVAVGVTDANGLGVIKGVPEGRYRLTITAAGFASSTTNVLVGETTTALDLGRIALTPDGQAIVVTGERTDDVALAPGANSFLIENNALAQSGSVLSAMKGLPGITVEREGQVLLRGSDKVMILIDGKPSALTGVGNQTSLDSIPASNIERIDIINNPSARYGAQGSAGIINIVMRAEKKYGWSGHVGLKGGFGALGRRKPDLPTQLGSFDWTPKIAPYFSLNHNGDSADYHLQGEILLQRKLPNNEFTTRYYDDGRIIVSQVPENRKQQHYVLKGGTDQRLSDNDTLSVSGVFDLENHIDRAQVPFIETTTDTLTRYWFWREKEQTGHASGAINYRHDFPEAGHTLSVRAEYIRGWEDETYALNEVSPIRTGDDLTHIIAHENTVPVSVDYVRPMSNGRIEIGTKVQWRWIPVTYLTQPGFMSIIYPGLGETSDWKENIYAGYVNLVRETRALTIEAGLRAEQTKVSYTLDPVNIYYPRNDSYDYFRLFPNVRLTTKLGSGTDISLFYNRRVDRPGEPELRVFPKYDDPELLKVGNPYLRPQFTTAYEASIQQDWDSLNASLALYHRRITDAYQRIYAIDETNTTYNIINKIYANTGKASNTGAELIAHWKAAKDVKVNASLNAFRIHRDAAQITLLFPYVRSLTLPETSDFTWDGKLGVEAPLGKSTKAQLNGVYYAARDIAQGRQAARGSVDFSLTRTFDKERIKASLSATDIFNTFGTKTRVNGIGFDALYENYYETQAIMLSLELKI
ncbi:MAG: TonB dependent receptor [Sphingobium sp.]|nr:TonB-dependent receptor [Sphingobium sp.]MCP5398972.1 TonB-dependent receptor [Sphingomonas sp.]